MENSFVDESETEVLIERPNKNDKFNIVYLIIFFTGIGTLIPWNFFITANSYFKYQLSNNVSQTNNSSDDTNNNLQHYFENYLALFSMIPLALTNIANLLLRRYITPMKRFNTGIIIMFAVFLVTLVFTRIDVSDYQVVFFGITMVSVTILNICSGLIQGSSFGIILMMPDRFIKAVMEGQAISGMLAAITQILSISVIKSHVTWSAFIYFLIALIFLVITGVGFSSLGKIKFSKAYVEYSSILDNEQVITESTDTLITINNNSSLASSTTSHKLSLTDRYMPLIKQTYWYILSAYLTFTVTLSLFPALISEIKSLSGGSIVWTEQYFSPVICFLFFNCADYLGRFLTGFFKFPSDNHPKCIFLITFLRVLFIPLFMLCNISNKKRMPTIFKNDAFPIIFNWLLGISNGYFGTLTLIYAPNQVSDSNKEAVGTIMSLFLCLGLTSGVALSFIFVLIV